MAKIIHDSDCAVHNEPAQPNGPCNCGAEYLNSLEAKMEYCYRAIHYGFTFGTFDFSILKEESAKFVINKDTVDALPR